MDASDSATPATAIVFRNLIIAAFPRDSPASWPDRPPIAFPARQMSMSELQIKPVAAARERRSFDVRQSGEQFIAGTASNVIKLHAERLRGLVRRHAERQGNVRWRQLLRLRRQPRQHECCGQIELSIAAHARHSTATSVPPGVQPPPSAWNRLVAARSLLSRTWISVFSAVNSVCSTCNTVMRLT